MLAHHRRSTAKGNKTLNNRIDPSAGATPTKGTTITLTEEEVKRAKEVFRNACANGGNESSELNKEAFIECIKELVSVANKRASSDDADTLPMPNEQDLNTAFDTADADKSGFVDEGEFIELYGKVKAGKVEGLGGGFFSNTFAFSMFRTPLMQVAVSGGDADDAKAKADEQLRQEAAAAAEEASKAVRRGVCMANAKPDCPGWSLCCAPCRAPKTTTADTLLKA